MIKKAVFAAFVFAGAAFGATSQASAMPMAADPGAASAQVQLARYGCGPGWHPNRWGRCVPVMRHYRARPPRYFNRPVKRKFYERRYRQHRHWR